MPDNASLILKQKRERLISGLKGNSQNFMIEHTGILDNYFQTCYETSLVGPGIRIEKNPYAIIALGGYGRKEQCVHSDVDLLFLFENTVPDTAEALIQEMVYPLWDVGLDVGHATRSVSECAEISRTDIEAFTAHLDARFVCGMSPLYTRLMSHLRENIIQNQSADLISWLIQTNALRHKHFGDSAYLLEPNLKEGRGGLRDYHTIRWIAKIKSDIRTRRDLEYYGYFSSDEFLSLSRALTFIWHVRNHLHRLAGRKCDQLYTEYQPKLARILDFHSTEGQSPVESMLGKIQGEMEFLNQQLQMFLYELSHDTGAHRKRGPNQRTRNPNLEIRKGAIYFASSAAIPGAPLLLMQIFEESARFQLPLSAEAKRLIKEFQYLADETFISSKRVVKLFEKLLMSPPGVVNALDEMLSSGFLVRILPDFKGIVHRVQYDDYHLFPVDKHSLHVVQTLKKFALPEDTSECQLCGRLYQELATPKWLLLAGLLHDIGKGGAGKDHSKRGAIIAAVLLAQKGYRRKDIETVCFLIEEHLFLIKLATRRDINDEETAVFCARKIKDVTRLKMLYLLTVADSISTGPKAWNEWTASLLRDFFLKVLNILEKGELASHEAVDTVEKKKEQVVYSAKTQKAARELDALFNVMPPRYLLFSSTQDIVSHIQLYRQLKDGEFVWTIDDTPEAGTRMVTICAKDRPGLFSRIAGVFTLNGLDILDAQIFTWRNNIALDLFHVKPPLDQLFEEEKWGRARGHLQAALSGNLDLAQALKEKMEAYRSDKLRATERPHRVVIDNQSSSFFTIIEVFSRDFPGLLFGITDALFRCKLDVWVAKIATKVDQVVDVFYVRDFDGQKVDSADQESAIQAVIMDVLQGSQHKENAA
jgi:[protein-PII] uridylyltransferase